MTSSASPSPKDDLTAAKFERLLLRLDPNRDQAAEKYEEIRWKLIKFFQWGACVDAEDLVDETFNRVGEKLESDNEGIHDVTAFVWGVAKNIRQEALRRESKIVRLPDLPGAEEHFPSPRVADGEVVESHGRLKCLRRCIQHFSAGDRRLLLKYHAPRGRRGEGRRRLAQETGLTMLALRVRVNRLRFKLEQCIKECLASSSD
jgi:DNA-directed RNA polymerase specialized sigma24 family protein